MDFTHHTFLVLHCLPFLAQLFLAPSGPCTFVSLLCTACVMGRGGGQAISVMNCDGRCLRFQRIDGIQEILAQLVDVILIDVVLTLNGHQDLVIDVLICGIHESDHVWSHTVFDHVHGCVKQLCGGVLAARR